MKRNKDDPLVGFGALLFVFFFIKGKQTIHMWDGKHFPNIINTCSDPKAKCNVEFSIKTKTTYRLMP